MSAVLEQPVGEVPGRVSRGYSLLVVNELGLRTTCRRGPGEVSGISPTGCELASSQSNVQARSPGGVSGI